MKTFKMLFLPLGFGFVIGALVMTLERKPKISISLLINAGTTLAVGWWIHSAVRRRGELERVSTDYLSNLSRRIDELTIACLGAANQGPERMVDFKRLSNEIYWLGVIVEKMKPNLTSATQDLNSHFVNFKGHLTGGQSPDMGWALKEGNEIRMTVLKIHWQLCRCVIDGRYDTGLTQSLGPRRDC